MTLLEIVQKQCRRTGIPRPSSALGSSDSQVLQIVALLEEEGEALSQRHLWQALGREATLTTLAAESQGAIGTLAPGFWFIKNGTFWDRDSGLPVNGPVSPEEWQAVKAAATTSPQYSYRILENELLANPVPTAGLDWRFEYQSNYWILDPDGTTTKSEFSEDTDTVLLPDSIMLLGLRWRWMREKGLAYGEVFNDYEMQIKDAMARDGGSPVLGMAGGSRNRSGISVPIGSWPL